MSYFFQLFVEFEDIYFIFVLGIQYNVDMRQNLKDLQGGGNDDFFIQLMLNMI